MGCGFMPLITMRSLSRVRARGRSRPTCGTLSSTGSTPVPLPATPCGARGDLDSWGSMGKTTALGAPPPPLPPPTQKKKDTFLDNQFLSPGRRDMHTIQTTFLVQLLHSPLLSLARGQLNPRRKRDTRAKTVSFLNRVAVEMVSLAINHLTSNLFSSIGKLLK